MAPKLERVRHGFVEGDITPEDMLELCALEFCYDVCELVGEEGTLQNADAGCKIGVNTQGAQERCKASVR